MITQHHTITALVQNEAGTINRLVSLFRRRGFSLASFNAGDCEDPGFSRLTFIVDGDDATISQCLKQLDKLIDVVECEDLKQETSVQRELALIRVEPTETISGRRSTTWLTNSSLALRAQPRTASSSSTSPTSKKSSASSKPSARSTSPRSSALASSR